MSWTPTPWFVGGGAQHSPEIARLLAYAATGGAEGVAGFGDLKVQALAVPGAAVRVGPGGCLIPNRYAGGGQQTYVARNTAEHQRAIGSTGSGGGRSDLVVARVSDPQYAGNAPVNPVTAQYVDTHVITGVPAGTRSVDDLNLTYPAEALARVDLPASTATITNAMITDLRRVAMARRERRTHVIAPTVANTMPTAWGRWPSEAALGGVLVPKWATRLDFIVHVGGARHIGAVAHAANLRPKFAGVGGQQISVGFEAGTADARQGLIAASQFAPVAAAQRGSFVTLELEGLRGAGGAYFQSDMKSIVIFDWEFSEYAV